jgi:hypothetical protein
VILHSANDFDPQSVRLRKPVTYLHLDAGVLSQLDEDNMYNELKLLLITAIHATIFFPSWAVHLIFTSNVARDELFNYSGNGSSITTSKVFN